MLTDSPEEATLSPSDRDRRRADDLLAHGRKHMAVGQTELAIARFRDALKIDPQLTAALVELGSALYAADQLDDAADAFTLAAQQQPDAREALIGLARTRVRQRQFPEAQSALQRVVALEPSDAESWLHLGDVAVYRGDEIAAREHYRKASTLAVGDDELTVRVRRRLDALPTLVREYHQDVRVHADHHE